MDNEMEKITYPMSLDYVKDWKEWQALREIISNAMDTKTEWKITREDDKLVITDSGKGIQIKQLLFGVSEKEDKNAIGQFGEGLKLALLVLTRMEKMVEIYSGEYYIINTTSEIAGVPVLELQFKKITPITGTKVIIHNWDKEDFSSRFLSKNDDRIIMSTEYGDLLDSNDLFVKGVWVSELSNFELGYNITKEIEMNRDRSAVSQWQISNAVGNIWKKMTDQNAWELFFLAVKENKGEKDINISSWSLPEDTKNAMMLAFAKIFGEDAVIKTSDDTEREAKHIAGNVVDMAAFGYSLKELFATLIKTDVEFIKEKKGRKAFGVKLSDLTPDQKKSYSFLKKVARKLEWFDVNNLVIAKLPEENGDTDGFIVRINQSRLNTISGALSTFIHELAHLKYHTQDTTDAHVRACTDIGSEILMLTMKVEEE